MQNTIACPDLPHIDFALPKRKFIPVSFKVGRPVHVLDLKGRVFRKLYVLLIPFLDNHDMFCTVGRVTVRSTEDVVYSRTLRFPGDLDWWFPPTVVREFATVSEGRSDRFGLLPLLPPERADWNEGLPPAIPQPRFWSSSLAVVTPSSVMNVIEVDLGRPVELESLTLEAIGVDPSFGIVAVTGLTPEGLDALQNTPWNPPARFHPPRTIFSFEHNPSLNGWRIEGDAFSVATIPSLFMTPTLNSLAQKGEAAIGKAISPDFQLMRGDDVLLIQYHGGRSKSDDGAGLLAIDLVDSVTGQRLHRLKIQADHTLRWARIPARGWAGKSVHIELIDQNADKSFAW